MMDTKLVGRQAERQILLECLESHEAEMISVIGRRRVGKTYLVRQVYQKNIVFEYIGVQNGSRSRQLANFMDQLVQVGGATKKDKRPTNWTEAFQLLRDHLKAQLEQKPGKLVVFFDEVPWVAGQGSDFLQSFGYFWNAWASNERIVVVICGSSASWMIRKILKDKGGLHNRVTKRIRLLPFTLAEAEVFLQSRGQTLSRYHIMQIYMAMGGIPHYLKEVRKDQSASQNIQRICFTDTGLLADEFANLLPSLFERSEYHLEIVRALSQKHYGLQRKDIVKLINSSDSGRVTKVLEELEQSGFITAYVPHGKLKREMIYRLTDAYTLFYLRFIEPETNPSPDTWNLISQSQTYKIWAGYAFENVCLTHVHTLKKALGILGVYTTTSSFVHTGGSNLPVQIDLILDRADYVLNLVEMKFHHVPITISTADAVQYKERQRRFLEATKTQKMTQWVLLSMYGLHGSISEQDVFTSVFDMQILFE